MTTFGIEWDTKAVTFIPDAWTQYIPEKGVILEQNKIKITLEDWDQVTDGSGYKTGFTRRRGEWPNPAECFRSLEAILGVFISTDATRFNIGEFITTCSIS